MSPTGSTGQDSTIDSGGITGYSHQAVPHYPQVSISASLHCAHILLLLFLFYFSATDLLLLVALGVSECLGSSQEWSQECYAPLMHYDAGQGSSQAWSEPYIASGWCSFQASSLSGPYGTDLVVI